MPLSGRFPLGRVTVKGAGWMRLASGEAKTATVRAIPMETGGVRARLSGEGEVARPEQTICTIYMYSMEVANVYYSVHVHACTCT